MLVLVELNLNYLCEIVSFFIVIIYLPLC